jgi:hypothetical protein
MVKLLESSGNSWNSIPDSRVRPAQPARTHGLPHEVRGLSRHRANQRDFDVNGLLVKMVYRF